MKPFLNEDFLLSTETAKKLYHEYSKPMPIIDYHCHINPKEIWENRRFENITQIWLGGDHYKWRQMRSNGIPEKYITGDASDFEKFEKWAETLPKAIGNPLYHWSHLELKKYFGYTGFLNSGTAKEVWELTSEKLKKESMGVRNIIKASNVEVICTTDDPIDSLEYHEKLKNDSSFDVKVLPAWRPDQCMNIEKVTYNDYIEKLAEVSGVAIATYVDMKKALSKRMDFFADLDCNVSDHGLEYIMYKRGDAKTVEAIFQKKRRNETLSEEEIQIYKTEFMIDLGKEYSKRNWIMQLHYGCKRDNNQRQFKNLGPDTGYDCVDNYAPSSEMADFLNALEENNELPKTIIYSLNPNDNAAIGTIIGCFQSEDAIGKVQHGSAWWFNDHKTGMTEQMISLANLGLLGNFVGMLTDSRSFLSYTRHEYFRRILCELLGSWVENGEYPEDYETLKEIVEGVSYGNAKRYFDF
ncbi:MAG: glucuronate isomerase [Bacillota bacterium]